MPISWLCKKQTSVSHASTEAEIISLGAGLLLDGIPALDLWDFCCRSVSILHQTNSTAPKIKYEETRRVTPHQTSTLKTTPSFQPSTTNSI